MWITPIIPEFVFPQLPYTMFCYVNRQVAILKKPYKLLVIRPASIVEIIVYKPNLQPNILILSVKCFFTMQIQAINPIFIKGIVTKSCKVVVFNFSNCYLCGIIPIKQCFYKWKISFSTMFANIHVENYLCINIQ